MIPREPTGVEGDSNVWTRLLAATTQPWTGPRPIPKSKEMASHSPRYWCDIISFYHYNRFHPPAFHNVGNISWLLTLLVLSFSYSSMFGMLKKLDRSVKFTNSIIRKVRIRKNMFSSQLFSTTQSTEMEVCVKKGLKNGQYLVGNCMY